MQSTIYISSKTKFLVCFLLISFFFKIKSSSQSYNNDGILQSSATSFNKIFLLAENARANGNFLDSIPLYVKAAELARRANKPEDEAFSLIKLGDLYWNIGKLEDSIEAYEKAATIAKKQFLSKELNYCRKAINIHNLYLEADNFLSLRKYQVSLELIEKAFQLSREVDNFGFEIKCLRLKSLIHWETNQLQEFFILNSQALERARKIKNREDEAKSLNNIGLFYWKTDHYAEALKIYEKALEIAISIENTKNESECLNNLSLVYSDLGDLDRSLEYLNKTLYIDHQLKDEKGIAIDLLNIGETFRRKGLLSEKKDDFISALKYFNSSLEISKKIHFEKMEIKALNNIGNVYSQLEDYETALESFKNGYEKARGINDIEEMSILLTNLGIVNANLGKYVESTQYYEEAISLALQFRGDKILWEAYLEIANALKKQGKFEEALASYKKSISIVENVRSQINLEEYKAGYMGTDKRLEAYQNLLDLLVTVDNSNHKENYGPDIFNFLERAKARAFLDSLEVSDVEIKDGASQALINQEAEIMNNISKIYTELLMPQLSAEKRISLNQNLESLEDKFQTVKRKIRDTSPVYAGLKYPEIITLKEAQEKLADSETAFFAYSLAKEKSYAFVLTRHQFKVFPLPPVKELRNQIQAHLKAISDPTNLDFRTGYDLYKKLISPGLIKGIKKIIIIPDDFLYFLPFETLLKRNDNQSWLIEEYKISYSPSLSSLREIIQRKKDLRIKAKQDLLAIGDPDYGTFEATSYGEKNNTDVSSSYGFSSDFKLNKLQYSGLEIDKIASLFPRNKTKILEKDLASEETLKAQNLQGYKIIHFAAHGLIDDKKPARSAIVLKLDQDPQEDGFLQMREIFNLKLNADLVTLSACQTGGGQLIRGEGIEGLSRAFFYAGASSVLMSLWAVNDQATYQLMERFYSHLRSSESLTSALQKAQLEMIDSGTLSHPYYWAGFIISGNSNTVPFQTKFTGLLLATFYIGSVLFITITSIRKKGKKSTNP